MLCTSVCVRAGVCMCVLFREEGAHKIKCPEVASGIFWSPDTCRNSERVKKQGGGTMCVCVCVCVCARVLVRGVGSSCLSSAHIAYQYLISTH